jgi:hypothetical protein
MTYYFNTSKSVSLEYFPESEASLKIKKRHLLNNIKVCEFECKKLFKCSCILKTLIDSKDDQVGEIHQLTALLKMEEDNTHALSLRSKELKKTIKKTKKDKLIGQTKFMKLFLLFQKHKQKAFQKRRKSM